MDDKQVSDTWSRGDPYEQSMGHWSRKLAHGHERTAQPVARMKSQHIAALVCFGVALLLAVFASSAVGAGGFAFIGFIFESMAWKKMLDSDDDAT